MYLVTYSHISSVEYYVLVVFGGFPLGSFGFPFINMRKGLVHDVSHCFNLGKKCVPPY